MEDLDKGDAFLVVNFFSKHAMCMTELAIQ